MSYQPQVTVTLHDLHEFNVRHFLQCNNNNTLHSLIPVTDSEHLDDDDLGYYPDGTKRTLTDQQIEIFRHSEIQKLQRERRRKGIAGREPAEGESSTDTTRSSLTVAGQLAANEYSQASQEHEQESFESTGKSCHELDKQSTEETEEAAIQDSDKIARNSLKNVDQRKALGNSQKQLSTGTNPFGRRLIASRGNPAKRYLNGNVSPLQANRTLRLGCSLLPVAAACPIFYQLVLRLCWTTGKSGVTLGKGVRGASQLKAN
ncbi:hypothetical protein HCDG_07020 [Histoplasma capsulatum H143]|uniref:Uncharacterized protein n=1 Tax=Ajellomyces capsulatus (strain H143) TaxID=544712 RepID=C6HLD9_AJECH|nr:hypothetical protein HCDG_07020 [Histoplasma capsulatum H143]